MDIIISSRFDELESAIGSHLSPQQRNLIYRHLLLLLEKNKVLNLTRIESVESAMTLHIQDSLMALPELNDAPEGPLCDIGTGGGYPGIPLAIVSNRPTLLVDSVKKKVNAVQGFIDELNLSGLIHTSSQRIEDLALIQSAGFSAITARALSSLPSLVELAAPLLKHGGRLIALKGKPDDNEIIRGDSAAKIVGLRRISSRMFSLDAQAMRTIITYEKVDLPHIKLPRRNGLAQKQPLA